jgi:hypothetical protein
MLIDHRLIAVHRGNAGTRTPKARAIRERLGQSHIGKIMPRGQQQHLEHRKRRPGLFARGRRVEPGQNPLRGRKIDPCTKLIETRRTRRLCAERKCFLPDPPKCRDPLQNRRWKDGNHGPPSSQAPQATCTRVSKHFRPVAAENLAWRKTGGPFDEVRSAKILVRSKSGGNLARAAGLRQKNAPECKIALFCSGPAKGTAHNSYAPVRSKILPTCAEDSIISCASRAYSSGKVA